MIRTHELTGPRRVLFGAGSLALAPDEVERLGVSRVLVVAGSSQSAAADRLRASLGDRAAGELRGVRVHVPAALAAAGRERALELAADCLLAVGGGSATGLAKAIAATARIPIVAVPTTYAGSEATATWGVTENGRKRTARDEAVRPRVVVYDPELTTSLPGATTAASGMNALAHCVEALRGPRATPLTDAFALEGVRLLREGLPRAVRDGGDPVGREQALAGAWLAGEAFAAGGGLHHALCHALGGRFDLPHAELHSALLPHTARRLLAGAPEAEARLRAALEVDDAPEGLAALARRIGAPTSLAELGLTSGQLRTAAATIERPAGLGLPELECLLATAVQPPTPHI